MTKSSSNLLFLLSFVTHLFLFCVLCSVETLFIDPQNSILEIDLWMVSIVFMALHRKFLSGLAFIILGTFFFGAYSALPYYQVFICFFLVFVGIHIVKSHSFSNGPSYFTLCSALSILFFYFSLFMLNWIYSDQPIQSPHIIKWITSALASAGLFTFIRPLLILIDKRFNVTYPFGYEV